MKGTRNSWTRKPSLQLMKRRYHLITLLEGRSGGSYFLRLAEASPEAACLNPYAQNERIFVQ